MAYYSNFYVDSEENHYKLILSGYDKTRSTLADGLTAGGHANTNFTTRGRDNDGFSENCAEEYSGGECDYLDLDIYLLIDICLILYYR